MVIQSPIAIGGVGGSGTRLIAGILKNIGYFIGDDLNFANDNLTFTLLFKRTEILNLSNIEFKSLVEIFINYMTIRSPYTLKQIEQIHKVSTNDRLVHSREWLEIRKCMLFNPESKKITCWGWKEPNSHIIIDRLYRIIPGLKYIHVIRNGLDMAYSKNKNQMNQWGKYIIPEVKFSSEPSYALKYWCAVHRRIHDIKNIYGTNENFLFLNFDNFCKFPLDGLQNLLKFLNIPKKINLTGLLKIINIPDSMGRYKQHSLNIFDPEDIQFVREMGFEYD